MQQLKNSNYPSNAFGRFWMKVPLVVRSVLTGFGVSSLGVGIWVLLVTSVPVPWSIVAMGTILILFWRISVASGILQTHKLSAVLACAK